MIYEKTNWVKGDIVTSQRLNKMEQGIYDASAAAESVSMLTIDDTLTQLGQAADAKKTGDEIADKVDKVQGKGLSTEDFTTAEKTKLAGIATGATNVVVDNTLTQTGAAADAKKTGDEIADLKSELSELIQTNKTEINRTNFVNLSGYFIAGAETHPIARATGCSTMYVPCLPDTEYEIDKILSNRFIIAYTTEVPANEVLSYNFIQKNSETKVVYKTGNDAQYLCVYYKHDTDSVDETTIYNSIRIYQRSVSMNVVRFDAPQVLTETQKAQANANIGISIDCGQIYAYSDHSELFEIKNAFIATQPDGTAVYSQASTTRSFIIPCFPNAVYSVEKMISDRFRVGYMNAYPTLNAPIYSPVNDSSTSVITITTGENAQYLIVYYYQTSESTPESTILNSVKIHGLFPDSNNVEEILSNFPRFDVKQDKTEKEKAMARANIGIKDSPINILSLGGKNDGTEDIGAIINAYTSQMSIYLPVGKYLVTTPIRLVNSLIGENSVRRISTADSSEQVASVLVSGLAAGNIIEAESGVTVSDLNIICNGNESAILCNGIRMSLRNICIYNLGSANGVCTSAQGSRVIYADNITIVANPGVTSVGFDFSSCMDCRLTNLEIMRCQVGIKLAELHYLANVHIWNGSETEVTKAWYDDTVGIYCGAEALVFATNLYLDSAFNLISFEDGAKMWATNLMTWRDSTGIQHEPTINLTHKNGTANLWVNGGCYTDKILIGTDGTNVLTNFVEVA